MKKGTIIYGGTPGQSSFYFTESALKKSGNEAAKLWKGLQVKAHPVHGYRTEVTAYEVLEDVPAAFGLTRANPTHGVGGFAQIVIRDYSAVLRPLRTLPLR